jgi:hypothetical protein
MGFLFSFRKSLPAAVLAFFVGLLLSSPLLAQSPAPAAPAAPDSATNDHLPPVSAKINSLAHRVLASAVKTNALAGAGLKPWHLKIDFQYQEPGNPKPVNGTVEEWAVGPDQWKRTFTGPRGMGFSEWSVSRLERYQTKQQEGDFQFSPYATNLRVARPVIDPLYQVANIHPDYEMDIARITAAGLALNCVSVVDPARYAPDTDPDWLFPKYCFDQDLHLRLVISGKTTVEFDDIQLFQGRAVAHDVKVRADGNLQTEMKVSLLEPLSDADSDRMKPDKDAAPQPYYIEPGFPRPESVYEVAAVIPIQSGSMPYRGTINIPIIVRKDGSVKVLHDFNLNLFLTHGDVQGAVATAVERWKYKPYVVDGQVVEPQTTASYVIDGKPFVPSYDRPKPAPVVTDPNDYTSTYDPKRDPHNDLAMAEADAAKANKKILIDVGGDWCIWCKRLDKFFVDHPDLAKLRDSKFVVMKVNMGPNNENVPFLSNYPKIPGYPWIFVLDFSGKLLASENTDNLENRAGSYSPEEMKKFFASY